MSSNNSDRQNQDESSRQFTIDETTFTSDERNSVSSQDTFNMTTLSKHLWSLEKQQQKNQQETQTVFQTIFAQLTDQNSSKTSTSLDEPFSNLQLTIEHENNQQRFVTLVSITMSSTSKFTKLSNAQLLSDEQDLSFESWMIQVQEKLKVNADHYFFVYAQILCVFDRITDDAQKHLQARYRLEAIDRFETAQDMIDHLVSIYINLNRERETRYLYNNLRMKTAETFLEFQTKFLHLTRAGNIAAENLRDDLYDKLIIRLQNAIALVLLDLSSYSVLSRRCISLDAELTRIDQRNSRVRETREKSTLFDEAKTRAEQYTETISIITVTSTSFVRVTIKTSRRFESVDVTHIICFNCEEKGHYVNVCFKSKKSLNLKDIEKEHFLESSRNEHF